MRPFYGRDEHMKFYLIVKYNMFKSNSIELLRRFWAAYVVFLVFILYAGNAPVPPSKATGLIALSLIDLALFIWGVFKS